jgi:RNA polymerase sigma factor for flagellar operon FliA
MKGYANANVALRNPERDQLIADHIDMARRIAGRVGRRVPDWIREDDLVGAAMIGLTEAADRFDASQGLPFVAFAERRIRGAVLDELRRGDPMPRRKRADARKLGKTIAQLEGKLGRPPEDAEIADAMGVGIDQYREELEGLTQVSFVDFDELGDGNLAPANDNSWPSAATEKKQLAQRLHSAMETLPERDALVLSLYYVEELSYLEIAEVLSVSESRVCQLHARALARLKAELEEKDDE